MARADASTVVGLQANYNAEPIISPEPKNKAGLDCWQKILAQAPESDEFFNSSLKSQVAVGSWFYLASDKDDFADTETSLEGKFFLGLAKANLLVGREFEKDIPRALELLREVHETDPSNSAPLLYLAIIEKLNGNESAALADLQKAQVTQHFNSYLTKVSKTVFAQVKSPQDYIAAVGVVSQLPIPDYNILREFLIVNKQAAFGVQLMQDGLSEKNLSEFLDWVGVEYAIGRFAFNKILNTNDFPDFTTLMKTKKAQQKVSMDKVLETLNSSCDIDSLWPYLSDLLP